MLRYSSWKPKFAAGTYFYETTFPEESIFKDLPSPREPLGHVPEPPRMIVYLILTVRPRERPAQAVRAAAVEVAHELPVDHVRPVLARVAAEAAPPEAEGRIQGHVGQ